MGYDRLSKPSLEHRMHVADWVHKVVIGKSYTSKHKLACRLFLRAFVREPKASARGKSATALKT